MSHRFAKQHIPLGPAAAGADPDPGDPAWRAWQVRVDHGLIGSAPARPFDLRLRMMCNEVALFGRVVTRELEQF